MKNHQQQLQVIEQLMRTRPQQAPLYRALQRILLRGALTRRWDEHDGKLIKVWSTNSGASPMHLLEDIENDIQEGLVCLFIEGSIVFSTDINATPEIRFLIPKSRPYLV